jgi:hypothetical protein
MKRILDNASPAELLRLAKAVRKAYVADIANTKEQLDPARLRALDENIRVIASTVN